MKEHKIVKIGIAKFMAFWPDILDSGLILDFNPLIEKYQLLGEFVIIHFQAKPFGYRQWGAYDSSTDNYFSFLDSNFSFGLVNGIDLNLISISEKEYKVRPTSVMLIKNAKLDSENEKIYLTSSI